jgi:hypothetical protein
MQCQLIAIVPMRSLMYQKSHPLLIGDRRWNSSVRADVMSTHQYTCPNQHCVSECRLFLGSTGDMKCKLHLSSLQRCSYPQICHMQHLAASCLLLRLPRRCESR